MASGPRLSWTSRKTLTYYSFFSSWFFTFASSWQVSQKVIIKRILLITHRVLFLFLEWIRATTPPRSLSDLLKLPSSSSTQTVKQMKPGGQTCCPLRLIYCCSKETLRADHRPVRRVLLSTARRVRLNFLSTHTVVSYCKHKFALHFLYVPLKNTTYFLQTGKKNIH